MTVDRDSPQVRAVLGEVEQAIRRVSQSLKAQTPWDMAVTEALDALADELAATAVGNK